jgi:sugar phosphate isomerase/epimerase
MSKLKIGAQLYTLRDYCKTNADLDTTFAKVRKIGYTQVQMSAWGAEVDLKKAGEQLKKHRLKCSITHMGWQKFRENLDGVIADHQALGCAHTAIGGVPGDYFTAEGAKKLVSELGPIIQKLAAAGLDFAYHNHSAEMALLDGKVWMQHLFDESIQAGVPVNAELDTYWIAAGGGDPAQWLRKWAGKCPVIHLKDMSFTVAREQRTEVIGQGNLNWPEILKACAKAGVQSALVEQDNTYGRDPFECLQMSYDFLAGMGYR